jgi:hypothetical protein
MAKKKIAITPEPSTITPDSMAQLVKDIQREHGRPSREAKAWAHAVLGK